MSTLPEAKNKKHHTDLYPNASPSRRFKAAMVDSFFCVSLLGVILSILRKFSIPVEGEVKLYLQIALYVAYYAIPEHMSGQTAGKKIFDLRVIPENGDPKISLITAILRETIGKFISNLFAIGYMSILWREDRKGWHDRLFKTRVVSLTQEQPGTSFVMLLASSISVVAAVVIVGLYVVLYTSLPIKYLVSQWARSGVHVEGIKGSLARGITIKKMQQKTATQEFELENLTVQYHDLWGAVKKRMFEITEVSADKLTIHVVRAKSKVVDPLEERAAAPPASVATKPQEQAQVSSFKTILVDEIRFSKVDIEIDMDKGKLKYKLDEVSANDMELDLEKQTTYLKYFGVFSPAAKFEIGEIHFDQKTLTYEFKVSGSVSPQFDPKILKAIDYSGIVKGHGDSPSMVNLALFDNHVRFYNTLDHQYAVSMKDFTPKEYFKSAIPIHDISAVSISKTIAGFRENLQLNGNARLNDINFLFSPRNLEDQRMTEAVVGTGYRGDERFEVDLGSLTILGLLGIQNNTRLSVSSNKTNNVADALAHIYFGKSKTALTVPEKTQLISEGFEKVFEAATQPNDPRVPAANTPKK